MPRVFPIVLYCILIAGFSQLLSAEATSAGVRSAVLSRDDENIESAGIMEKIGNDYSLAEAEETSAAPAGCKVSGGWGARCGKKYGLNGFCAGSTCCSKWGWCGTGTKYCIGRQKAYSGGQCDMCLTNNGGCDKNAECSNGTFRNVACTCNEGYTGDGRQCERITCANNNGGCHELANCTDQNIGVSCSCKPFYTGDGKNCTDIDECQTNNGGCHPTAKCENVVGGPPKCVCSV